MTSERGFERYFLGLIFHEANIKSADNGTWNRNNIE